MKSTFLFLISICFFHNVCSQNIVVSGTIKDHLKNAMSYANIIFKDLDNPKHIFGTLANENGVFTLKIPKQKYHFEISIIGLPPTVSEIDLRIPENKKDLGTIIINSNISLDEVVINANNSNYKIELDKKVYNVAKDFSVSGGNLIDVMQNVPSVQVEVDGKMSIRGNGNIQILVDGRISGLTDTASLLRTIPAATIDKIEVITNPSSKYSAAGTG